MSEVLLPARLLFRFAVPCRHHAAPWTARGAELTDDYLLPHLGELEGQRETAQVRLAWNEAGLALQVEVHGKKHDLWCRENRLEDSDGIQVWISTRDTHNIHRATRFCHRFVFLPAGSGRQLEQPLADQLLVDRARENARPVRPGMLRVHAARTKESYSLSAWIPAGALTGYSPADHPRLGFCYYFFDRELGEQTWSAAAELPFPADPTLWGTLDLVRP